MLPQNLINQDSNVVVIHQELREEDAEYDGDSEHMLHNLILAPIERNQAEVVTDGDDSSGDDEIW